MNILIQPKSPMESLWISRVHSDRCVSYMRTRHKKKKVHQSIRSRARPRELFSWSFDPHHLKVQQKKIIALSSSQLRLTIKSHVFVLLWRWPLTLSPINEESNQNFTMEFDADEWAARVRAFEGFTREFDSTRERRKHLEFTRKLPVSFSSSPLFSSHAFISHDLSSVEMRWESSKDVPHNKQQKTRSNDSVFSVGMNESPFCCALSEWGCFELVVVLLVNEIESPFVSFEWEIKDQTRSIGRSVCVFITN